MLLVAQRLVLAAMTSANVVVVAPQQHPESGGFDRSGSVGFGQA